MAVLASKTVEWLVAGGLLTVLGALIRFRGWTFLLVGYDETSRVPDDVAQQVAGNTVLRVGIAVFAFGLFTTVTNPPAFLGSILGSVILVAVLRLLYRLNTWAPHST
jgi:hypothetical protein